MFMESDLKPIFHIGYHKTATTWFQDCVWPASTTHHYIPRAAARSAFLDEPGMHFDPRRASELLRSDDPMRPIVVCEENLSGYLHNGGMHGLTAPEVARRIAKLYPNAVIVLFIRSQPDILRAAYAQYVSGGGTHGPERYFFPHRRAQGALRYPYKAPGFSLAHFEYDRLIAFYDKLFGHDNVHVYMFEDLCRDSRALLERMEADLACSLNYDAIGFERRNKSFGCLGLSILRVANLFTRQSVTDKTVLIDIPGWQLARHAAKAMLGHMPFVRNAGRNILSEKLLARIRDHYAPSNARLLRLRQLDLEENHYPLPSEAGTGANIVQLAEHREPASRELLRYGK